jgi:uncharacterized protein (TIGR00266 family)
MKFEIIDAPEFGFVRVVFEDRAETVVAESGAMVSMSGDIQMETKMKGGFMQAAKRKLMGGESIFQNTYRSTSPGQELLLAPAPEGDVKRFSLTEGQVLYATSGAYLCHSGDIKLDSKIAGLKSFFGGVGFFMLQISGEGELFLNSYGAMHAVEVGPAGYTVDNNHIVAFTEGLTYTVRKFGGFKGLFFSGEGLVTDFAGQGTVYVQTREAPTLAGFLHPYRPVKSNNN